MPDCGPRDPRSPAPLRPLLLLLCALAPGATGLASGEWPPRFVSSAPLPLQTVRPPRPGCEDRGGDRGPPDPDSAIGAAWRGRSPAAFSGFCVPTSRTAVCVPPRGLGFQRLDEAQSVLGSCCLNPLAAPGLQSGLWGAAGEGPGRGAARTPNRAPSRRGVGVRAALHFLPLSPPSAKARSRARSRSVLPPRPARPGPAGVRRASGRELLACPGLRGPPGSALQESLV